MRPLTPLEFLGVASDIETILEEFFPDAEKAIDAATECILRRIFGPLEVSDGVVSPVADKHPIAARLFRCPTPECGGDLTNRWPQLDCEDCGAAWIVHPDGLWELVQVASVEDTVLPWSSQKAYPSTSSEEGQ